MNDSRYDRIAFAIISCCAVVTNVHLVIALNIASAIRLIAMRFLVISVAITHRRFSSRSFVTTIVVVVASVAGDY